MMMTAMVLFFSSLATKAKPLCLSSSSIPSSPASSLPTISSALALARTFCELPFALLLRHRHTKRRRRRSRSRSRRRRTTSRLKLSTRLQLQRQVSRRVAPPSTLLPRGHRNRSMTKETTRTKTRTTRSPRSRCRPGVARYNTRFLGLMRSRDFSSKTTSFLWRRTPPFPGKRGASFAPPPTTFVVVVFFFFFFARRSVLSFDEKQIWDDFFFESVMMTFANE